MSLFDAGQLQYQVSASPFLWLFAFFSGNPFGVTTFNAANFLASLPLSVREHTLCMCTYQ